LAFYSEKHNPNSPFLIGETMETDKIHQAEKKSWKDGHLSFEKILGLMNAPSE